MKNEPPPEDELNEPKNAEEADDPFIEECLRDALGPLMGALSPEQAIEYRALLTAYITTHPSAKPIYDRLRSRPAMTGGSGNLPLKDAPSDTTTPLPLDGTRGLQKG